MLRETDFQPPPAPPDGVSRTELGLLSKRLESYYASIDAKLDRLLQVSHDMHIGTRVNVQDAGHAASSPDNAAKFCKGWLAVQASGGSSPHSGDQDFDAAASTEVYDGYFNSQSVQSDSGGNRSPVPKEENDDDETPAVSRWETFEHVPSNRDSKVSATRNTAVSQGGSRAPVFFTSGRRRSFADKVWTFFQDPDDSRFAYAYELVMRILIVLSVLSTLAMTLRDPPLSPTASAVVETSFEVCFLLEVFVRFLVSPHYLQFWLNVYNLIDLLSGAFLILRASLLFTIPQPLECHLACSILVGFCPVVRSLKLLRRMHQFHLLYQAFKVSYEALQPLLSMWFFMLLVFTGVVFIVEPRSNLADFPAAGWFTFVSMTTIGYGDVTPETGGGACIIAICVLSAMIYMAIPLGIIGNAFNDVWRDREKLLIKQNVRQSIQTAGYKASQLREMFTNFDKDNNGQLDAAEFNWLISGLKLGLSSKKRKELFNAFDEDESGGVNHRELVSALFPKAAANMFPRNSNTSFSSESQKFEESGTRQSSVNQRESQALPRCAVPGTRQSSIKQRESQASPSTQADSKEKSEGGNDTEL